MGEGAFSIVACFASRERERFIIARHEKRGWELPGGTVEAGESAFEAAMREFREEIGHSLDEARIVLETDTPEGPCTVVAGFLGDGVQGEDDAIKEWRWVSSLSDVEPLAWPDDPYGAIGDALGVTLL